MNVMGDSLAWYFWTQALGLAGWLVAGRWLSRLPDRGYGASKALGVLLTGFVFWLSVTAGLAQNSAGGALLSAFAVAGFGSVLHWAHARRAGTRFDLASSLPPRATVIATEVVFAGAFAACALYRSYTPDIGNAGGEKFMEMMFINGILRSPSFPPNDAWLSGFSISYYYFGYVILAMITRLSGVAPAVGFNLGGAMVFALSITGAFSLGYNLWAASSASRRAAPDDAQAPAPSPALGGRRAVLAGVVTATLLGVMGNLGGLVETGRCAGVVSQEAWRWLDIHNRDAANARPECVGLAPTRFYWWWNWSRVVHDYSPTGGDMEVITESPAFSFILGDNHPHVMALPFVLVAASLALHFYLGGWSLAGWALNLAPKRSGGDRAYEFSLNQVWAQLRPLFASPDLLLTAVIAGGLSFMNTWDFPVYGALIVGALLLRRVIAREPILPAIIFSLGVFVLGYALYLPFYATFSSQARGIGVNLFNGTRISQFFLMFAPFLLAMPGFVWLAARELRVPAGQAVRRAARLAAGLALVIAAGAAVLGLLNPTARALASEFASTGQALGVNRENVQQAVASRWEIERVATPAFLLIVAAACGAIVLGHVSRQRAAAARLSAATAAQPVSPFVLLLFLGGALLTLSVEFIFLQDNFGTRMNTVFKFYYMAWVVWAVAGGYALMRFLEGRSAVAVVSAALVGLAALAGMLYPVFAAQSKADYFRASPTLDGAAYLRRFQAADAAAIDWLNRNVTGDAVIAEAPGDKFASYKYEGRMSTFTGLPTLLGWGGHQSQWRGNYVEPGKREPDIESLFQTTNVLEAQSIANRYAVEYVVVGPPERQRYRAEGLAKFELMGTAVFRSGDTVIYRVR